MTDVENVAPVESPTTSGTTTRRRSLTNREIRASHSYSYDPNGNLTSYQNGRGFQTTFGYDGYDRRAWEESPGAPAEPSGPVSREPTQFTYDPDGNALARQDACRAVPHLPVRLSNFFLIT